MSYNGNINIKQMRDIMRKNSKLIGICIMAMGVTILVSCFLPSVALVCIEALLLIFAGFLYFSK